MSKIFITGSADGLGLLSAKALIKQGHEVVMHARNAARAEDARRELPEVSTILTADLSSLEETKELSEKVNALGTFDAIIHNAGVYQAPPPLIFVVNTLAPYILTCLIRKPGRLIYLSSGMHLHGQAKLEDFQLATKKISYSDSKLHVVMLAKAVARLWPNIFANAVDPGWVPTKMGGKGAPDDLQKGYETQVWLAVSDDPKAKATGQYFFHQQVRTHNRLANDVDLQQQLLENCERITKVSMPK